MALVTIFSWVALVAAAPSPEMARLTPTQQDTFARVAANEFCACDSALTLAGCLEKRPKCRLAGHLQRLLARGVEVGAPQSALESFLSQQVLGPYCAPPITLKIDGAPTKGRASAPLTVLEFADFRCSHCRAAMPAVHKAVQAYEKKVKFTYVPISLQDNELSTAAAEAALSAQAQGKFWEMHQALFTREEGDFDAATLSEIAAKVGLNKKQFDKDMASHRFRATLTEWRNKAFEAGVDGTPAFFINGRRFNPEPDIFTLEDRFEMEQERSAQSDCK